LPARLVPAAGLEANQPGYVEGVGASSQRRWWKRALLIVPVLGLTYGTAWAVQGYAPFFPASSCPEPTPSDPASSPSPSGTTPSEGDERLSLSFGFQPDPLEPQAAVRWNFGVTNVSDEVVTMTFSSGQDGDVVLSQNGEERYRWSAGRFFTQAVRPIELAPGEALRFTLEDTLAVEPGSYELLATVSSDPAPGPATRSVAVGDPSASGASETPSPSESPNPTTSPSPTSSPSPSEAPSPTESPSPSPSPSSSESPTSTPGSTAGPVLLLPPLATRIASRRRTGPRKRGRERFGAIALVLALVVVSIGSADAQEEVPEGGSGGKNVVLVINQTDGRLAARAGLSLNRASGPTAVPENLASATASCTDCRTVAVALQAVVLISDPNIASPRNAAVAVNAGCVNCQTFAYAWQYVVSTGGPVRFTPEAEQTIADLRAEASALAASDLAFPELVDELDEVAAEFRAIVDGEMERVGLGRDAVSERALDVEAGC
jgi:intracellular proteinase inhibitor BsuPI